MMPAFFERLSPSLKTADAADNQLTRKVQRLKAGMLYDQLAQGLVATLINAALTAFIVSSVVEPATAWLWFTAITATCAARFALLVLFKRQDRDTFDDIEWSRNFTAGSIATAACWGMAGVVLFPAESYQHQAFIGFVLAGMAAGASGSMVADDKTFRAYAVIAIAPYMLRLLIAGHSINIAMAVMCAAFIAALSMSARKNTRCATDALRLQFENLDLVAKLESNATELNSVNEALTAENAERQKTESDLLKANDDAKAASRAKSQFLANMSHEIRTPMNGVFGMTDLLSRTDLDDRQRKLVKTINESAKSLLTIINDILDLSRIEAGKLNLDSHEFSLKETIERSADMFVSQADGRGIELSVFIAKDVPAYVKGDSGRLKQVVLNLVGNALKFTKYGEVGIAVTHVSTAGNVSRVKFEIHDTGIGIDAGLQEKLFQPFAQAETSISRRFGGTGLGLSIARHLVDLMGGTMELHSELGKGTRICFELPLEHGDASGANEDSDLSVLEGARLLVIDDRETNRIIIKNYLEGAGAQITCAASAAEGWPLLIAAAATSKPFHAVVVDMMMPVENGLQLSQRIRDEEALSSLKTILATSLNWQGDLAAIRSAGIEAVLTKPLRRHELTDAVARAISGIRHPGWRLEVEQNRQCRPDQPRRNFNARVLLAEDNPVNVEVAKEFLSGLGCSVHVAANGLEAVAFARAGNYDIVLMDCQMPVMDGLTATRRIRVLEFEQRLARRPIIAVTANAFAEDRILCVESGMDDYLCKPYSEDQLEQVLSKWLSPPGTRLAIPADTALEVPASENSAEHARQTASSVAILDPAVTGPLREKRPELLVRLVNTYLSYAPVAMQEVMAALAKEDFTSIGRLAHSLKSSSANLGAATLSATCRQLELAANEKRLTVVGTLVETLHRDFADVKTALDGIARTIDAVKLSKTAAS